MAFVEEQIIAKSAIVLDVKPWDDETDLQALEKSVRSIETDGLIWGQGKEGKEYFQRDSLRVFFRKISSRCFWCEEITNRLCC